MNIKPLTATCSKQEEKDVLDQLVKLTADPHCYLNSLFTDSMVSWCKQQITDDIAPDLFEVMLSLQSKLNEECSANFKLSNEITVLKNTRDKQLELKDDYIARLQDKIQTSSAEHAVDIKSYREAFEETAFRNDGLIASNTALHEEVKRLKCEIYDLLHSPVEDRIDTGDMRSTK